MRRHRKRSLRRRLVARSNMKRCIHFCIFVWVCIQIIFGIQLHFDNGTQIEPISIIREPMAKPNSQTIKQSNNEFALDRDYQITLFVFAGRKNRMEILVPYLHILYENKQIDHIHFWDKTANDDDKLFLNQTVSSFSNNNNNVKFWTNILVAKIHFFSIRKMWLQNRID